MFQTQCSVCKVAEDWKGEVDPTEWRAGGVRLGTAWEECQYSNTTGFGFFQKQQGESGGLHTKKRHLDVHLRDWWKENCLGEGVQDWRQDVE
jgi:hypothetical protein